MGQSDGSIEHRAGLEVLERAECVQLLGEQHLGRLAVTIRDQPVIFPVNYAMDADAIVFRTDPGTKLHGALGQRVAFEIDGTADGTRGAWSVLVVGRTELIEAPGERKRLAGLTFDTWFPGPKMHWARIRPGAITGRRVPSSPSATEASNGS